MYQLFVLKSSIKKLYDYENSKSTKVFYQWWWSALQESACCFPLGFSNYQLLKQCLISSTRLHFYILWHKIVLQLSRIYFQFYPFPLPSPVTRWPPSHKIEKRSVSPPSQLNLSFTNSSHAEIDHSRIAVPQHSSLADNLSRKQAQPNIRTWDTHHIYRYCWSWNVRCQEHLYIHYVETGALPVPRLQNRDKLELLKQNCNFG